MARLLGWVLLLVFASPLCRATTLPPELKAYDFGEAYYVEDGGVVVSPYDHGFVYRHGVGTPEGIRFMPGDSFTQLNPDRHVWQEFFLVRLNKDETRAFFHERIYRYAANRDARGHVVETRGKWLGSDDFYLSRFRGMEPFDHVFTNVELHPGSAEWRTRQDAN